MDIAKLRQLVAQGEGQQTEFKLKASHPDKIMKEVIAFANSQGGWLLVGVNDNRSIPGLPFPDEDEYLLEKAINEWCHPAIQFSLHKIRIAGEAYVIAIFIESGPSKPYYLQLPNTELPGKAFVRVRDKSIQASRELRQIMKQEAKDKALRIEFGEKERKLIGFLQENNQITLNQFITLCNIPARTASRTLVLLCCTGVLRIIPDNEQDVFVLKDPI